MRPPAASSANGLENGVGPEDHVDCTTTKIIDTKRTSRTNLWRLGGPTCRGVHRIPELPRRRIHAVADSPPDQQKGPLVVLLHGFRSPGTRGGADSRACRRGHRVVAIDQRAGMAARQYRVQKPTASRNWLATSWVLGSMVRAQARGEPRLGARRSLDLRLAAPRRCAGVVGISVPLPVAVALSLPGNPFGETPSATTTWSWPGQKGSQLSGSSPCWTASSRRSRKTCGKQQRLFPFPVRG